MDTQSLRQKLHNLDCRVSQLLTKEEFEQRFTDYRDTVLTGLDKQMVILVRLDQERIFTNEKINRMHQQIETTREELCKLKEGFESTSI